MRVGLLSLTLLVAVPLSSAAALEAPFDRGRPLPRTIAFKLYKEQMTDLRAEAIELQARDGGTLSSDNRARIQRRINHIERVYRERLRDGHFAA